MKFIHDFAIRIYRASAIINYHGCIQLRPFPVTTLNRRRP